MANKKITLERRCVLLCGKTQLSNDFWEDGVEFKNTIILQKQIKNKRAFGGYTYTITIIDRFTGKTLFKIGRIKEIEIYNDDKILLVKYTGKIIDPIFNHEYAVIDTEGNFVIPFGKYKSIFQKENNVFRVVTDKGVGMCNREGIEIITPKYDDVRYISKYYSYMLKKEGNVKKLYGIYFNKSNTCIHPVFKKIYIYDTPSIIIAEKENGENVPYDIRKGEEILCFNTKAYCEHIQNSYTDDNYRILQ